ncbi:Protein N-lysine methyltransferase FAM173B [Chionoecetes opilio]|uniref:Protein N-lysine methyltransferase FAM173B n=1 Tax=Chionoecetes opilio TaxID=41210 RepID=A0A8J4YEK0_CHIOP|nr:Protein N-lysine methyltransferase FAM173B [Chionoecetes opilio]
MDGTVKGLDNTHMEALLRESGETKQRRSRGFGLALVGLTGGAAVALSVIAAPFVTPALRKVCLPFVPATSQQVRNVMAGLKGRSGQLVDLGSGDGRIVSVAEVEEDRDSGGSSTRGPHEGCRGGAESWLVWYSRWAAWRGGVAASASFITRDLWRLDLRSFQNVVIFGVEEMMPDLESKLSQELTPDGLVIACRFPLPSWKPVATIGQGIDAVWVYHRPRQDQMPLTAPQTKASLEDAASGKAR